MPSTDEWPLAPGDVVDHFKIVELVGIGSSACVFRALDTALDRIVALRVLRAEFSEDEDARIRFRHGVAAQKQLNHENIVRVVGAGESDYGPYVVLENVTWPTLRSTIESFQLVSEPLRILGIARLVANALAHAHSRAVIHRDLKPSNIFIDADDQIKISDWGAALFRRDRLRTGPGIRLGTVSYMSPEQLVGAEIDGRSDFFALGVILYEILAGKHPFAAEDSEAIESAIRLKSPERMTSVRLDLPLSFSALIMRCLEKDPEARFRTAEELLQALKGIDWAAAASIGEVPSKKRPRAREGSLVGLRISHYSLESRLGKGGWGAVYLAQDHKLRRKVAIKFLDRTLVADTKFKERFFREQQVLAGLSHPAIVMIYDADEIEERFFFTMEYVRGNSLDTLIDDSHGGLDVTETIRIAKGVADALDHAHTREIPVIHRDLKPTNILIQDDGRVRIVDFGVAYIKGAARLSVVDQEPTQAIPMGTPAYMSHEQAVGKEVDGRTDIFSLGVTFYEMLTGRLPYGEGGIHFNFSTPLSNPVPIRERRPDVPERLDQIIVKCLSRDPQDRFASAAELRDELTLLEPAIHAKASSEGKRSEPSRDLRGESSSQESYYYNWPPNRRFPIYVRILETADPMEDSVDSADTRLRAIRDSLVDVMTQMLEASASAMASPSCFEVIPGPLLPPAGRQRKGSLTADDLRDELWRNDKRASVLMDPPGNCGTSFQYVLTTRPISSPENNHGILLDRHAVLSVDSSVTGVRFRQMISTTPDAALNGIHQNIREVLNLEKQVLRAAVFFLRNLTRSFYGEPWELHESSGEKNFGYCLMYDPTSDPEVTWKWILDRLEFGLCDECTLQWGSKLTDGTLRSRILTLVTPSLKRAAVYLGGVRNEYRRLEAALLKL